jgi:hypothetical protein
LKLIGKPNKTLTLLEKNFRGVPVERRVMKHASGYQYFDTREQAVDSMRNSLQRSLEYHERSIIDCKKKLEALK